MISTKQKYLVFLATLGLTGCFVPRLDGPKVATPLVAGPPVSDIVTPFDNALTCLAGKINPKITFSVGSVIDQTGKEQFTEGGAGKFVTQGAGDIVQSALFKSGATVLNRRDPRIIETEHKWGLGTTKTVIPSNYFITGSINSLDFIPGGGIDVSIGGIGPRYREHRILVGLDLSMTDTKTGRVVSNVSLQKQIFANDAAFGIGRFFGETLVVAEIGNKQREATHFAMRQMLNLATFDLLTQVMHPKNYVKCETEINAAQGVLNATPAALALSAYKKSEEYGNGGENIDQQQAAHQQSTSESLAGEPVPSVNGDPAANNGNGQNSQSDSEQKMPVNLYDSSDEEGELKTKIITTQ